MKTYILLGENGGLDDLVEKQEVFVLHRSRYVPLIALQTDMELETLQDALPEYQIHEEKEYRLDD